MHDAGIGSLLSDNSLEALPEGALAADRPTAELLDLDQYREKLVTLRLVV
jgi:hypothetical protein